MEDVDGNAGLFADVDGFLDGFENFAALVAHMGEVDAAMGSGFLCELGDFLGSGIGAGRVDEGGGESGGAVFHGFADDRFHLIHLFRCGAAVLLAHDDLPDLTRADGVDDVESQTSLFQELVVLGIGGPGDSQTGCERHVGDGLLGLGHFGGAFAGEHGGDALAKFAFGRVGVFEKRVGASAHHIDEAGR